MSALSSESASDIESIRGRKFDEEGWGDDVSIISKYEGPSPQVIIFKFILAILLISACAGALVYSIINSEIPDKVEPYETPNNFPIDTNQESLGGTLYITYRSGDGQFGPSTYTYDNVSINWFQDHEKKRIYHRVGLEDEEWRFTYYVFENVTFYVTKSTCSRSDVGYFQFLQNLGLNYVQKLRTEEILINRQYTETQVYEGEPPNDVEISGEHPSLIRGYSAMFADMIYGWEQYFAHSLNSNFSIYKQDYFFPDMQHKEPDYTVFDSMPGDCLQS